VVLVSEDEALARVAGAMPLNDVTASDLQLQNPLWTSGKAIDTFAPCGPALVTLDEAGDLQDLAVLTRINGEVVQEGSTAQMIFTVAQTVAWLSRTMTLEPGDIIATGTPAGVGGFKMRDGDAPPRRGDGVAAAYQPNCPQDSALPAVTWLLVLMKTDGAVVMIVGPITAAD
jgi:2-keto-4-pentenoate hydratase/2-oxohepta-3-ene-1,7-dioic acid hydratase in catechol pathway